MPFGKTDMSACVCYKQVFSYSVFIGEHNRSAGFLIQSVNRRRVKLFLKFYRFFYIAFIADIPSQKLRGNSYPLVLVIVRTENDSYYRDGYLFDRFVHSEDIYVLLFAVACEKFRNIAVVYRINYIVMLGVD